MTDKQHPRRLKVSNNQADNLVFDSELQWYVPVAQHPGKLSEYILYQKEENIVELRRASGNNNIKLNDDGTVSPIDPTKPSRFTTGTDLRAADPESETKA